MISVRILAPTSHALALAKRLSIPRFDPQIWQRPGSLTQEIKASVEEGIPTLAICSMGIIARTLSQCTLPDKSSTAPLICATEDGKVFIPVLGGHRGANHLAKQMAAYCGGAAIITTVSDQRFDVALDAPPKGWTMLAEPPVFAKFMQNVLESGGADLSTAPLWVQQSNLPHVGQSRLKIHAAYGDPIREMQSTDTQLIFLSNRHLAIGMGCERGCPEGYIDALLAEAEERLGFVFPRPLPAASIDLKADEVAFLTLAPKMQFFPAAHLNTFDVPTPSKIVFAEVGTHSVAEASALALAGKGGQLILPKIKNSKATLAVAAALSPIDLS